MAFNPAESAYFLADSFSYTGIGHGLVLVGTAPMFRLGATGECPAYQLTVDAETVALHPPAGFYIADYEQFEFIFSDLPGVYTKEFTAGQDEFTAAGYHGSWTGKMSVNVGS